jgi:hypothetical protein
MQILDPDPHVMLVRLVGQVTEDGFTLLTVEPGDLPEHVVSFSPKVVQVKIWDAKFAAAVRERLSQGLRMQVKNPAFIDAWLAGEDDPRFAEEWDIVVAPLDHPWMFPPTD